MSSYLEMTKTAPFEFLCLSRDTSQRRMIERVLGREGRVSWILLRPIGLHRYEEARAVAERALPKASNQPSGWLMRTLKLWHLRAQYAGARRLFQRRKSAVAVAWGASDGGRMAFMEGARAAGAQRLYLELAPLPGRITVDPRGVNALCSLPRTLEPYLAWADQHAPNRKAWRAARSDIRQRAASRSRVSDDGLPSLDEPFLFVPLQVPKDTQVRLFGGEFKSLDVFVSSLASAASSLPDGWHLRLKEHPSTQVSVAKAIRAAGTSRIWLDNDTDTFAQVAASRGVVTVNSSVGIQAFYFDKPVVVCGQTFWAIPGIATPAPDLGSLKDVFAKAETLGFDADARDAFMSYLSLVYFPAIDGTGSAASIAERLTGPDAYGFWRAGPRASTL